MKVHLWGELGFYGPGRRSRFEIQVEGEVTLLDMLRRLGVPAADVAVCGLNGHVVRLGEPSLTVSDGDRIDLFPATSGGAGGHRAPAPEPHSGGRSSQATASAPTPRSVSGGMKRSALAIESEKSM